MAHSNWAQRYPSQGRGEHFFSSRVMDCKDSLQLGVSETSLSVESFVGIGGHDYADDGADDGGHPVQVVHPAGVVDQEFVLEPRLRRKGREGQCTESQVRRFLFGTNTLGRIRIPPY